MPALLGYAIIMLQATSLCFTIALPEIVSQAYIVGSNTFRYLPIFVLAGLMFAAVCIPATIGVSVLERRLGRHDGMSALPFFNEVPQKDDAMTIAKRT